MELKFIDIHTHTEESSESLLQIINLNLESPCPKQGFYSYGIHPWALDDADFQAEKALQTLEEKLKLPQVLALGEAGLDKIHKASFERQVAVFERQIQLSEADCPWLQRNRAGHKATHRAGDLSFRRRKSAASRKKDS